MHANVYTVDQVSAVAHVSVRTLHHYDQVGLLSPSRRSAAGYRLYDDADLRRLHQVLVFRELGFPLDAVQRLLDATAFDRRAALRALRAQRELLEERVRKGEAVIRAVDDALREMEGGTEMDATKMFEGFEELDHARYEQEARERWGHTDAHRESERRTKGYGKDDWRRIRAEGEAVEAALADLLAAGVAPDAAEAMDAAERHREHIDRWYYPLTHAAQVGLAEMYLADPRFREHYDRRREGLAEYVAAAIRANAARAGG